MTKTPGLRTAGLILLQSETNSILKFTGRPVSDVPGFSFVTPMRTGFVFFALFLLATISFAGTKEDIEQVNRNVLDLQRQFWDLGKELQNTTTAFNDTVKKLQGSNEEVRDNQAALNAKLESILNQLQAINEKLNETNQRIKGLESSGIPGSTAMSTQGSSAPPAEDNPGANLRSPVPTEPSRNQTTAGSPDEQQLFRDATAQYSKGEFEQALRAFQDLLDQYPNSRLADDAQYMIGESYYGMKEYVDAVTEYDQVIKRYPDSDRIAGARLKKAFSLTALGKKGQAVVELQQIVQRYPSSKEAQIARQRLAELGLD